MLWGENTLEKIYIFLSLLIKQCIVDGIKALPQSWVYEWVRRLYLIYTFKHLLLLSLLFLLFALLFNTSSYLLFFRSNFWHNACKLILCLRTFLQGMKVPKVVIKSEWLPWLSSGYLVNDYIFKRLMHIAKGAF